jgi:hypothetical protein
MRKIPLFVLILLITSFSLRAQRKPSTVPAAVGVSASTMERVVKALAADDMQGRAVNKSGEEKAAQYLAGEFNRIGLAKLPGLTSYEQTFPAYESRVVALFVTLNGISIPKNKLLLVSSKPHLNWTDEDEPVTRIVTVGPQEKLEQHMSDIMHPHENLIVLLSPIHARAFKRLAHHIKNNSLRADKEGSPFSSLIVLTTAPSSPKVKFQVAGNTTLRTLELRNIVGVLPGKDASRMAEQVIFSSHYDHLGILDPMTGDSIANGANDNASGTAAVVALAEYFKRKNDNGRTLVFVAFTAKEAGGFGSAYFAKQIDPTKVAVMFNLEMIGRSSKFGPNTAFITGFTKSNVGLILQAGVKGTPFRFESDPYPGLNLFYHSDNAALARVGVPVHSISTHQIPTDKLYHSVEDEVQSLDFPNMTAVATALARGAANIVAGQQTPSRITPEMAEQKKH